MVNELYIGGQSGRITYIPHPGTLGQLVSADSVIGVIKEYFERNAADDTLCFLFQDEVLTYIKIPGESDTGIVRLRRQS